MNWLTKFFLFTLLLPLLTFGAIKENVKQDLGVFPNFANSGFEHGRANWSRSGTEFVTTTTEADVGFGYVSGKLDTDGTGTDYFEQVVNIPNGLKTTDSEVYVSQTSGDVISGSNSLVIDNEDHTNYQEKITVNTIPSTVSLASGNTYVVEFDWKILETIDDRFSITTEGSSGILDHWTLPGFVTADYGTEKFPITITSGGSIEIQFSLHSGGGKVVIDNIRITEGGAGPWRRDFENGFVLVNPINKEYTFSAAELKGDWSRTGIKRILGTQDPNINTGQDVSDTLTLQAFDAIILLADNIQTS